MSRCMCDACQERRAEDERDAELATLRARIAAAVAECERLERASGAEQCQTELPFRVAARRIRAKLEGR